MIITKIYLIALILMCGSCSNRQTVFTKEVDGFDHSCPKRGHGDCFLCDSKGLQINKNKSLTLIK